MKRIPVFMLLLAVLVTSFTSCSAGQSNYAPDDAIGQYQSGTMTPITNSTDPSSDDYGKIIENEFISTSSENVSTFSADVDTASYSYFRRLVESGYSLSELIATAGSSIRTEEMINYFDYGYSAPRDNELFSATAQIAPCPYNEDAVLLMLGLQAKEIEIAQKNNLIFLIDVSGSMNSSDKLELLKTAFSHLTDKLGEDDTVSIVTYSGKEEVVLKGCSGARREKIMNAVRSLKASGSTNGEAGLKKAYQIAEEYGFTEQQKEMLTELLSSENAELWAGILSE